MTRILLLFCCITTLQARTDLDKLPRWAQAAYHQAHAQPAPAGADAWVLLDRTECAYIGNGEIRLHCYRVVEILTEHALSERVYMLDGLGGNSSKIKKLKGWNLQPEGHLEELESSDVISFDSDDLGELTTKFTTAAVLQEVVKGSIVAWESLESLRYPLGPAWAHNAIQQYPIASLELSLAKQEGWFSNLKAVEASFYPHNLEPYCHAINLQPGKSIQMLDVKPISEKERGLPYFQDGLPWVSVIFLDPGLKETPNIASWDALSTWIATVFDGKATSFQPEGVMLPEDRSAALSEMAKWLAKSLSYRQVYLNPKRGWIPEESQETLRRHYGDCKDLATCAMGITKKIGFNAFPVLVSIQSGHVRPAGEVYPYGFNHVITAIQLEKSLGFPAEIQTPKGLFLLYDATAARSTPMGLLPASHRGRSAMICTPEGAVWVAIPDSALQQPRTDCRWKGELNQGGNFTGNLTIRETGGWLRYVLLDSGRKALEKRIAESVGLPPTGHITLESNSDPMDAASPFQVVAKLEYPNAFQRSGGEWSLARMGIPGVPGLIQPAGKPRQMPVALGGWGVSKYDFELNAAQDLLLPQGPLTLDTPLRHARASITGTGHQVHLELEMESKESTWSYEKREEGVKAQRSDRSQWKEFLEELLTFKPRA